MIRLKVRKTKAAKPKSEYRNRPSKPWQVLHEQKTDRFIIHMKDSSGKYKYAARSDTLEDATQFALEHWEFAGTLNNDTWKQHYGKIRRLTINGVAKTVEEWATEMGITPRDVKRSLRRGEFA